MKDIFIVAGEPSGDLHAANLARAIRRLAPGVRLRGMGGPRMAEAGVDLRVDLTATTVMGVWRVLAGIAHFLGLVRRFRLEIERDPPDGVVLVDYPGLNFALARTAAHCGIPCAYYVCPQLWAWAPWRVRKTQRLFDLLLVIFPFEEAFFSGGRARVRYVGHPLFDELRALDPDGGTRIRRELGIAGGESILGIFPGSRAQEVSSLVPTLLPAAERIARAVPSCRPVISCHRSALRPAIEEGLRRRRLGFPIVEGSAHPLMQASDIALVASGTATLELAYFETPMVVLYRIAPFERRVFELFIRTSPFISTVNILSGRRIVPEEVLDRDRPEWVARLAIPLARPGEARERCVEGLSRLRASFRPGASERAAREILSWLVERGRTEAGPGPGRAL
ncbi:MAG: lipid-A-disaccharide synthase [Planctomycetes bacterium]|nr:lipid-A-disaccharide synthase [Planctomycetota bacterium]